jgi:hypothetical protein
MQYVDLSVFTQHVKTLALVDNDPGSRKVRKRFEERCKENSVEVVRLKRYSIENYFRLAAIRTVLGSQVQLMSRSSRPSRVWNRSSA